MKVSELVAPLLVEGMTPDEHRAAYPWRWRKKVRAWPFFWWSLLLVPVMAALNWLFGETWDSGDTYLCMGWSMGRFWVALDPDVIGKVTNWYLDKPTVWQKFRAALRAREDGR